MTDNITLPRQTVQQALEALAIADNIALVGAAYTPKSIDLGLRKIRDSVTALRTALEQHQADPVACKTLCELCVKRGYDFCANAAKTTPIIISPTQPQRKPLTDEEIEQAQREVWRSLPSDFDYTTSSWIELGIRYAEAAHDIKGGT